MCTNGEPHTEHSVQRLAPKNRALALACGSQMGERSMLRTAEARLLDSVREASAAWYLHSYHQRGRHTLELAPVYPHTDD